MSTVQELEDILDGVSTLVPNSPLMELPATFATLSNLYKQYDLFLQFREHVYTWGTVWGGVDNWACSLDILFKRSIREGWKLTRELVRQVYRWREKGEILLSTLDELQGNLPRDPLGYTLLWRYHNDQVKSLVKGITILACRLESIQQSSLFPGELEYHTMLGTLFSAPDTVPPPAHDH